MTAAAAKIIRDRAMREVIDALNRELPGPSPLLRLIVALERAARAHTAADMLEAVAAIVAAQGLDERPQDR